MDTFIEMISGGVGGACLVIFGYPLDTIKVRIQTSKLKVSELGIINVGKQIYNSGGLRGFYKGIMSPLCTVTPMYACSFLGFNVGKNIFYKPEYFDKLEIDDIETLTRVALAGSCSGFFTAPILCPSERVKCMMQVYGSQFSGSSHLAKHIIKQEGIRSLYRGYCASMLYDGVASMTYFSTYELTKYQLFPYFKSETLLTLLCGGLAGMMSWFPALPIDTLKSRYQTSEIGKYKHGIRSVAKEIFTQEGIRGISTLYRGLGAVMLRSFPANASCFLGYETAKKYFQQQFKE